MAPPRGRPATSKVSSPSDTSMVDADDHRGSFKQDEMDATVSLCPIRYIHESLFHCTIAEMSAGYARNA